MNLLLSDLQITVEPCVESHTDFLGAEVGLGNSLPWLRSRWVINVIDTDITSSELTYLGY